MLQLQADGSDAWRLEQAVKLLEAGGVRGPVRLQSMRDAAPRIAPADCARRTLRLHGPPARLAATPGCLGWRLTGGHTRTTPSPPRPPRQVGILPTDTLPAVVCDLEDRDAVLKLYNVMDLDPKKQLSILCRWGARLGGRGAAAAAVGCVARVLRAADHAMPALAPADCPPPPPSASCSPLLPALAEGSQTSATTRWASLKPSTPASRTCSESSARSCPAR